MRNLLILGSLFTLVIAGCGTLAPHASAATPTAAAPEQGPTKVSMSAVEALANPPPCRGADLIYHARLQQMLLVNCIADPSRETLLTLWGWDGTHWKKLTEEGPLGRILGGAAYDELHNKLVVYGGRSVEQGNCSLETWEWDGEFWEQKNAAPPTACDHVKMVYDKSLLRSILFSGLDPAKNVVNEIWSWDGRDWTLLSEGGPESRSYFGFVYDPIHKQTFLYGGSASTVSDEFWVWKDSTWQQMYVRGPGRLSHFGMAFDTNASSLYIFGGATSMFTFSSLTDATWVLRDGSWKELQPAFAPSTRGGPAMAYDPVRRRIVLYGGFDADQNNLNDTWEWNGETWTCMANCD